jgi:hypothetical protein
MWFHIFTPYTAERHPLEPMPAWPAREGQKTMTIELRADLVEHLDAQAEYLGCSRAAYLRQLVVKDMERQGPAVAAKA